MVKIGKILVKTKDWKSYYRFEKPKRVIECEDDEEFRKMIQEKNVIALAISNLNIHLIAICKDGKELMYVVREMWE